MKELVHRHKNGSLQFLEVTDKLYSPVCSRGHGQTAYFNVFIWRTRWVEKSRLKRGEKNELGAINKKSQIANVESHDKTEKGGVDTGSYNCLSQRRRDEQLLIATKLSFSLSISDPFFLYFSPSASISSVTFSLFWSCISFCLSLSLSVPPTTFAGFI